MIIALMRRRRRDDRAADEGDRMAEPFRARRDLGRGTQAPRLTVTAKRDDKQRLSSDSVDRATNAWRVRG